MLNSEVTDCIMKLITLSGHSHKQMAWPLLSKNLSHSQNLVSIAKQMLYVYIPMPLAAPDSFWIYLK